MAGVGKSLELFFVDGRPDGILTARVFNWTGHVIKSPRTRIKDVLARPEVAFSGIYLLLGEKDGSPFAYIGEAENVAKRIKDHDLKKDWWESAIFVTTSANELNKAHVKYLESRLIDLALGAKMSALDNLRGSALPKLSEAVVSNMEEFIDTLLVVLPAIGVPLFVNNVVAKPVVTTRTDSTPVFVLTNKKNGIIAHARLVEESFVVLKDSCARKIWEGKETGPFSYRLLYEKLVGDGVIDVAETLGHFSTDYAFASPSAAASVVLGRTANGRVNWRVDGSGQTFKEWEDAEVKS